MLDTLYNREGERLKYSLRGMQQFFFLDLLNCSHGAKYKIKDNLITATLVLRELTPFSYLSISAIGMADFDNNWKLRGN